MRSGSPLVSAAKRRNMQAVRSKNTVPEMAVRKLLHKLGYRFRLHRSDLPGSPDIVFGSRRKIIEVRGCFWHQHPAPSCTKARRPATRQEWWTAKLDANIRRDSANLAVLKAQGWDVLVLWECELKDPSRLGDTLSAFLGPQRASGRRQPNGWASDSWQESASARTSEID